MAAIAFMFVGLLWLMIFIADKVRFVIMSCAAEYYFDSNKDRDGEASVCAAWSTTFCKHSGTIALGSFIHTLILVVKILVEIISQGSDMGDDGAAACIACLARCLISCIESAIEWLNTCAYCMTAITGDTYCHGAWGGFMLYLKHLVKFYFATYVASGFILLGMIGVVAANCGFCWVLMSIVFKTDVHMTSVWGPIATIGVVTFVIVCVFLGSFDDAVLATLMSLAVDLEINKEVKGGSKSFHAKLDAISKSLGEDLSMNVHVVHDNTQGY
jgi:solute carrier family 44 protein 1 (choline transporter-like protein)/choline transporter-like protein 2/4/5